MNIYKNTYIYIYIYIYKSFLGRTLLTDFSNQRTCDPTSFYFSFFISQSLKCHAISFFKNEQDLFLRMSINKW